MTIQLVSRLFVVWFVACVLPTKSLSVSTGRGRDVSKANPYSLRDSWSLIVLGDLHLEDDMSTHEQARQDCLDAVRELSLLLSEEEEEEVDGSSGQESARIKQRRMVKDVLPAIQQQTANDLTIGQLEILLEYKKAQAQSSDKDATLPPLMKTWMVSLGDLGRKDIRHEPGDAGTTKSFQDAKTFMDGFGVPYNVITGNHDLEGLDEFDTDQENLQAFLDCFGTPTPQFRRYIGERTLLLGLSTVRFRDAPYSSHEVHVDDAQIQWFLEQVRAHPAKDGWKILVFSHAPIMGSGLRVLQNVHVTNGCAWLNHCSTPDIRSLFWNTVQQNPQIKLWCSGHFHLSHDFQDSIIVGEADASEAPTAGGCTFCQVGVVGPASTRDGKRQTRLVRGCANVMQIYTLNHHERSPETGKATLRLDAEINLETGHVTLTQEKPSNNNKAEENDQLDWFRAYTPREEDGCYLESPDGSLDFAASASSGQQGKVCWWHMKDGAVLGLHQGQLVEYDPDTLSPLGIVVNQQELGDKEVVLVENGTVLVLMDRERRDDNKEPLIQVVHPNDDGSYWRKVQRNKRVRQEEKAREAMAKIWMKEKQQQ